MEIRTEPEFHETPSRQAAAEESFSLRKFGGLVAIACLFTAVGGYMDAYAYLAHGHVFANSQTGNVVFFAVEASRRDWVGALRHLPPIGAFILGVSAAHLIGVRPQKKTFQRTLICQAIELAVLCGLILFASGRPDAWVVPIISFVAALQHTSFGSIGPWTFATVMTTGNIVNATSGGVLWLAGREPEKNRGKLVVAGAATLSFFAGALLGAFGTTATPRWALVPCAALVLAGFLLTWRQRLLRLRGQSGRTPPA